MLFSYFNSDIFNNKPEVNVFYFPHVSSNVMGLVVEFFYSQSVQVTESTVQSLLETAELFKIKSIAQACCDFLQQKLSINNCISILTLAGHYVYADLWKKASLFILRHFQDVADFCPEFYTLPEEQLESFIENNELNVREERVVFEAVLRWINHAPDERRRLFPTLMSKVTNTSRSSHSLHTCNTFIGILSSSRSGCNKYLISTRLKLCGQRI